MQDMTTNSQEPMGDEGGSPLDQIISTVDGFMQQPNSISPETLQQLRLDLEDLKTVMDDDGSQESSPMGSPSTGGLADMIGGGR